jgi:hypothetical protein
MKARLYTKMYTLILYDNDNLCLNCFTDLKSVVAEGNNVYWHDGYLEGIHANFIIINTNANIDEKEDISHLIDQDIKGTLLSEGNKRDQQAQEMQTMINTMLFDPTNFEQDEKISSMQAVVNDMLFAQMGGV